MGWDAVHAEAEVLEHVISEELEEVIAAKLGNPTFAIRTATRSPTRELAFVDVASRSLYALEPGQCSDLHPGLGLRPGNAAVSASARIAPGVAFELIEKQPFDGPLFVRSATRCMCSARRSRGRCA